jgi:hypothetical protein
MVGVPFSAVTGGLFELNNGGSFWHGVWEGTKSGFVSSGISAIGGAVQYSLDYKVNIFTGKSLEVNLQGNYSVYIGTYKLTGETKYVGITKREVEVRWAEQKIQAR